MRVTFGRPRADTHYVSTQLSPHVDLRVDGPTLARARDRATTVLQRWGVTDRDSISDVLVVLSELVGNAFRYGGAVVAVHLDRRSDGIVVSVIDTSPAFPQPRDANDDDETGRGMRLIAAMTSAWGSEPTAVGKRVWAVIPTF